MNELGRPAAENTYRLEPKETDRFYPSKVKAVIETVILNYLKDKDFDQALAKSQAEKIAEDIKAGCK